MSSSSSKRRARQGGRRRGRSQRALLDTYQVEREPNVRAYIEAAIAMGRVVCTLDREVAAKRDADLLALMEAGAPPPLSPIVPSGFASCCLLADAPGAGTLFPQPCSGDGAGRRRMDDVLEDGVWLFARHSEGLTAPGVQVLSLRAERLAPFRPALEAWFDAHGAAAVLVRPDRYVFGGRAAGAARGLEPGLGPRRRTGLSPGPAADPAAKRVAGLLAASKRLSRKQGRRGRLTDLPKPSSKSR